MERGKGDLLSKENGVIIAEKGVANTVTNNWQ